MLEGNRGFRTGWRRAFERRWRGLQERRQARQLLADERRSVRPTAVLMLVAAGGLGLAALFLSRNLGARSSLPARPAVPTVRVVVAAADINFGERLTPDRLVLADWPAAALPKGSFARIDALITGEPRAALRPIAAGEIILAPALAGTTARLSTAPLLPPDARAMAIPVSEASGVSGLVFPGDRVDVFLARQPEEALPHAELVAQDVRVLAVGPDMNIGKDKPEVVRAVTLAVSPLQAQKLTLAIGTGSLSLALRHFSDGARIRLETLQLSDLNDGTTTRLLRKPNVGQAAAPAVPGSASAPRAVATPPEASVIVMRGDETSRQTVLQP